MTTILLSGLNPFSFSIPTLTRVSIEALPVILPMAGILPRMDSSSRAENIFIISGALAPNCKIMTIIDFHFQSPNQWSASQCIIKMINKAPVEATYSLVSVSRLWGPGARSSHQTNYISTCIVYLHFIFLVDVLCIIIGLDWGEYSLSLLSGHMRGRSGWIRQDLARFSSVWYNKTF